MANPFTTAFIKEPKRSKLDWSHDNTVSVPIGEAVPTFTKFIVPGDEVAASMEQIVRVAPMPVPTFVPLKVRHDWFFVPLRIMYGQDTMDTLYGSQVGSTNRANEANLSRLYKKFSSFDFSTSTDSAQTLVYRGGADMPLSSSLLDYLGYPVLTDRNRGIKSTQLPSIASGDPSEIEDAFGSQLPNENAIWPILTQSNSMTVEPIIGYHYIWRDWYRFTGIETNDIVEPYLNNHVLTEWSKTNNKASSQQVSSSISQNLVTEGDVKLKFGDLGKKFRVHLAKDMFTSVRYGNKPTVLIPTGANGTIPALREASAIQRFLDIISITGQRYFDKVKGLFGVEPVGPKDDRCQFLGRYTSYVKIGEVITTASTDQAQTGDYAGRGILVDGKYIFNHRFTEHGWLFCITSIVPEVAYSGLSRELSDVNPLDTPIPSLSQVGDQSVLCREVFFDFTNDSGNRNLNSFGDQFRYYAYKSHNNEVHGSFLMGTMRSWSPLQDIDYRVDNLRNVISFSKVRPEFWNYLFNDTAFEPIWGDRFFMNLNFQISCVRALPKYINYHL